VYHLFPTITGRGTRGRPVVRSRIPCRLSQDVVETSQYLSTVQCHRISQALSSTQHRRRRRRQQQQAIIIIIIITSSFTNTIDDSIVGRRRRRRGGRRTRWRRRRRKKITQNQVTPPQVHDSVENFFFFKIFLRSFCRWFVAIAWRYMEPIAWAAKRANLTWLTSEALFARGWWFAFLFQGKRTTVDPILYWMSFSVYKNNTKNNTLRRPEILDTSKWL